MKPNWQRIETAPEGVRVLLGPKHAPVVGTVRHWTDEANEVYSTASVVHYNGEVLVPIYYIDVWAPLELED